MVNSLEVELYYTHTHTHYVCMCVCVCFLLEMFTFELFPRLDYMVPNFKFLEISFL